MDIFRLFSSVTDNLSQHAFVMLATLVMFVLQRRRARRIFRLKRETVVVFTRYPEAGTTKTRLTPALGDKGATRAQLLMTDHLLGRLVEYQRTHRDLSVDVQYAGGSDEQMRAWLGRCADNATGTVEWHPQRGETLGHRMKNSVIKHVTNGEDRVVIIGSDIPELAASDVEEAMEHLKREDEVDMVIGEATDGGYYLIGLNTGAAQHIDELFEGMSWGTDQVYKQQFRRAQKLGLRFRILKRKLSDVDTPEDIPVMTRELSLTQEDVFYPRWSIVIPTLNEGAYITKTLDTVTKKCSSGCVLEIIVVDGGSSDDTHRRVLEFQKFSDVKVTLAECPKGRGTQCRAGADLASGFYLLFLHADSLLPDQFDTHAEKLLLTPGTSAGAFRFAVDALHIDEKRKKCSRMFLSQMQLIEAGANWRASYRELPYGDQSLFLTRLMYKRVGGYPAWPLLEDYHIVEKLQTQGHVRIVPGEPVLASARRWEKHGPLKVLLVNGLIIIAYRFFRVSPERLARWYYGKPKTD